MVGPTDLSCIGGCIMFCRAVVVMGLLASGGLAQSGGDAAEADLQQMQGLWKVEKAVRAGQEAPDDVRSKMRLKIEGNTFTILEEGNAREERADVNLDPKHNPRWIDIRPRREGADPSKGIYQIDGDTLKLCWNREGDRPKQFVSEAGTDVRLFILKRIK